MRVIFLLVTMAFKRRIYKGFARFVQIDKLPLLMGKKDKIKIQNTLSTFSLIHQLKSLYHVVKSILFCVFP